VQRPSCPICNVIDICQPRDIPRFFGRFSGWCGIVGALSHQWGALKRTAVLDERISELVTVALHYRTDGAPADLQLFEELLAQLVDDAEHRRLRFSADDRGRPNMADVVRELVTLLTTEMLWGAAHTDHDVFSPGQGLIKTEPGGLIPALLRPIGEVPAPRPKDADPTEA